MAEAGTSVTPCNVFTSSRVFTNWFGKERVVLVVEDSSSFYRPGRRVDLVVERQQLPAGNFRLRSAIKGIDGELGLLAQSASTGPRLSSGIVKITVMGSNCVMTARVTVPADCTTLPGSTSRKPTRPAMGAVIWQILDLNLVILHRSLVVFYGALVLQHQLFLVIQDLLCDGVARPRGTVAFKVHLCLREHILVSLQRALRLQKRGAVRTRIDVNQRIALLYQLPSCIVHGDDQAIHLAGNRIGIDRSDSADGVKVNADVAFLRRRARNRDLRRRGVTFFAARVAPYQHDCKRQNEQEQQNPICSTLLFYVVGDSGP